jgi:hypothetical protein
VRGDESPHDHGQEQPGEEAKLDLSPAPDRHSPDTDDGEYDQDSGPDGGRACGRSGSGCNHLVIV